MVKYIHFTIALPFFITRYLNHMMLIQIIPQSVYLASNSTFHFHFSLSTFRFSHPYSSLGGGGGLPSLNGGLPSSSLGGGGPSASGFPSFGKEGCMCGRGGAAIMLTTWVSKESNLFFWVALQSCLISLRW